MKVSQVRFQSLLLHLPIVQFFCQNTGSFPQISFLGVPEMFQTPENQGGRTFPLAAAQNADVTPPWAAGDISDLHTPEESGRFGI